MNWKVLLGIGVVILLAYLFVPNIASYTWVLFVLVCPLSMMFMMAGMNPVRGREGSQRAPASNGMNHDSDKVVKMFACPKCGYLYREKELADKCEAWCKEHNSCNLEIIKHGIPPKHEN